MTDQHPSNPPTAPPEPPPPGWPAYGAAAYAPSYPAPQQRQSKTTDGLAVAALVLGIVGLCFSWFPIFGIPFLAAALIGVGLGIAALARASRNGAAKAMAAIGLALSGLAVAIGGVANVAFVVWAASDASTYEESTGQTPTEGEPYECIAPWDAADTWSPADAETYYDCLDSLG